MSHDECGGCQLQHVEADAQREARRGFVGDAVRRLAKRDAPDPPIVPADQQFDYRTKITLAVSADGRRIGLHRYDRAEQVFELALVPHHGAGADGAVAGVPAAAAAAAAPARRRSCCGATGRAARTRCSMSTGAGGVERRAGAGGRARAARASGRRSGGRRRTACLARWPARARRTRRPCSSRSTPRWATGCGPTRSRRWGRWRGARCGTSTPASARPPPQLARRGRGGGKRRVRPARRGRSGGARSRRAAARRPGGGRGRQARARRSRRHQSAAHRDGRPGVRRARAAPARGASSTSPAIPLRWPVT